MEGLEARARRRGATRRAVPGDDRRLPGRRMIVAISGPRHAAVSAALAQAATSPGRKDRIA